MPSIPNASCTGILLLGLATSGCVAPVPEDHRAQIPDAPGEGEGMQFVQPDTVIPAGEERMTCWIPDWVPEQDYLVGHFEGVQSPMGHHVVALQSGIPRAAGTTFDCTEIESMTTLEPLVLPSLAQERILPEGYAVRLPAGAQIVIQSHYINYTDQDIVTADVARFLFHPADEPVVEASYLILNHGALELGEGSSEVQLDCGLDIDEPVQLLALLGHMHDLGTDIELQLIREEAPDTTLYTQPEWTVEYRDYPPLETWAPENALSILPGDTFNLRCGYQNDLGRPVRFPEEMCTAVGYYAPARPEGVLMCGDQ